MFHTSHLWNVLFSNYIVTHLLLHVACYIGQRAKEAADSKRISKLPQYLRMSFPRIKRFLLDRCKKVNMKNRDYQVHIELFLQY